MDTCIDLFPNCINGVENTHFGCCINCRDSRICTNRKCINCSDSKIFTNCLIDMDSIAERLDQACNEGQTFK